MASFSFLFFFSFSCFLHFLPGMLRVGGLVAPPDWRPMSTDLWHKLDAHITQNALVWAVFQAAFRQGMEFQRSVTGTW
jgi:hypothetical protein